MVRREFLSLFIEHHISRSRAPAAAFGDVDVPIGAAIIVARSETKSASGAIDCERKAFEFEERSGGSLVEFDSATRQRRRRNVVPEFLVPEAGTKTEGAQHFGASASECRDDQLPFELFLVPEWRPEGWAGRRFGGQYRASGCSYCALPFAELVPAAAAGVSSANAEQVGLGGGERRRSIVESIPFEDTPAVSERRDFAIFEAFPDVGDAKFDFDFAICGANGGAIHAAIGLSFLDEPAMTAEYSLASPWLERWLPDRARASIIASLPKVYSCTIEATVAPECCWNDAGMISQR